MKLNTFEIDDVHTYYIRDTELFETIANYLINLNKVREDLSHIQVYNQPQNIHILNSHKIVFKKWDIDGQQIIKTIYIPKGTGEYVAKIMQYLGSYVDKNPTVPLQKRPLLGDPYPKYEAERRRRPIFML